MNSETLWRFAFAASVSSFKSAALEHPRTSLSRCWLEFSYLLYPLLDRVRWKCWPITAAPSISSLSHTVIWRSPFGKHFHSSLFSCYFWMFHWLLLAVFSYSNAFTTTDGFRAGQTSSLRLSASQHRRVNVHIRAPWRRTDAIGESGLTMSGSSPERSYSELEGAPERLLRSISRVH